MNTAENQTDVNQIDPDAPNEHLFTDFSSIPMDGETDVEEKQKFTQGYKHKTINHFKVGRFEFRNHILIIEEESQEALEESKAEFERLYDGLMQIDKNNIVRLKSVQNETRIESRVTRGIVGTNHVVDKQSPVAGAPTKAGFNFRLPQQGK